MSNFGQQSRRIQIRKPIKKRTGGVDRGPPACPQPHGLSIWNLKWVREERRRGHPGDGRDGSPADNSKKRTRGADRGSRVGFPVDRVSKLC